MPARKPAPKLKPPLPPEPPSEPHEYEHSGIASHEEWEDERVIDADLAGQVVNVFKQIRLCVEAAGGTPDDIIKIEFWMKQPSTGRAALNEEWVKMFPDEAARPARHTQQLGADSPQHVSCAFTAVIGG